MVWKRGSSLIQSYDEPRCSAWGRFKSWIYARSTGAECVRRRWKWTFRRDAEQLFFNGVDGATGSYLLHSPDAA